MLFSNSGGLAELHWPMNPLRELMKRLGALAMGVVLAQWVLLPACPCQRQALFGLAADAPGRSVADTESIAIPPGDGHGHQLCSCDEHGTKTAHASCPEVSPPKAAATLALGSPFPAAPPSRATDDSLRTSGNDPPVPEALRLHQRCQVFLI